MINSVFLAGNLTADPELKFTASGIAVCEFRIAVKEKYTSNGQDHESVIFKTVVAWNQLAEHIAGSLTKGSRVAVVGKLEQSDWMFTNQETGVQEKRTSEKVRAVDVSVSLRFNTVDIKPGKSGGAPAGNPARAETVITDEPF